MSVTSTEVDPVEESTLHDHSEINIILKTVFDECPVIKSSITTFEDLPMFTSKLVFEDTLDNNHLEQPKQSVKPNVYANSCAPHSDVKLLLTHADLTKHQETYRAFLKCKTPDATEMKAFISEILQYIEEVTIHYPMIFYAKPVMEVTGHVDCKLTAPPPQTTYDVCPRCPSVITMFAAPLVLVTMLVLEDASSPQSTENQEQPISLEACANPCVAQPEMKEPLTLADVDNHQKAWETILQYDTWDISEMKLYMSQTMQKMRQLNDQFSFYQKEIDTLKESRRQQQTIEEQRQSLEMMFSNPKD